MPTREVNLTEELDRFVLDKVESGRYESASDVIHAALRTLERQDAQLTSLRAAIDEGDSSGIADGDVFGRVRHALNLSTDLR